MSQRRTTVPPTRKHSPSPSSGRSELIAKERTKKQSARKRSVLDNHFYRTDLAFRCAALHMAEYQKVLLGTERGADRGRVGCNAELGGRSLILDSCELPLQVTAV